MSVEDLRSKIAVLRELGFADPVKMIESRSTIADASGMSHKGPFESASSAPL